MLIKFRKPLIIKQKQINLLFFTNKLHYLENFEKIILFFVCKSIYIVFFKILEFNYIYINIKRKSKLGN